MSARRAVWEVARREMVECSRSRVLQVTLPGFAKTVYGLGTRRLEDDRTLLWAVMRTATSDEHARAWFRRYWTLGVGSGAHVLVNALVDVVREDAERRSRSPSSD
jgi:hypothetical protein